MLICPMCKKPWSEHGNNYIRKLNSKIDYYCNYCGAKRKPEESQPKNWLIIGDVHLPAEHSRYLEFCKDLKEKYEVPDENVGCVGDIVDHHFISFHNTELDAHNARAEIALVREKVKDWAEAFPKIKISIGNHDELNRRVARASNMDDTFLRTLNEVYGMPDEWEFDYQFDVGDFLMFHGVGFSGYYPMANAARAYGRNIIIGHSHSAAGVYYIANPEKLYCGVSVGCGVDRESYQMRYGKYMPRKPVVSAVILLEGKTPIVVTMDMG